MLDEEVVVVGVGGDEDDALLHQHPHVLPHQPPAGLADHAVNHDRVDSGLLIRPVHARNR
jgi:hypothetical protein